MRHLITLVEDLRERGVGFRSLNEGAIDTTSASGELIFNIFSALAQFERRLIQERTKAGLAAARARGRNGGRPKIAANDAKVLMAKKLHNDMTLSIDDICTTLKMSHSTQQFPLAGTTTSARVPFSPVVSSQTNFRFRSPAITARIGSLHKLRVPERSPA
jgi:hypothetical protein